MSPVRPFGGESLQEMIDRYNRELMEMGGAGARRSDGEKSGEEKRPTAQTTRPPARAGREEAINRDVRTARPEPIEPLYGREQRQPRPEPDEPLDEPRTPDAIREYRQGIEDIRQGQRDREQGERDMRQAQLDREQGMRDIQQGQRDREQGLRDRQQAQLDREQGERDVRQGHMDENIGMSDKRQAQWDREREKQDMTHAREDLMRGLEELREGLRELERLQREYLTELPAWKHHRAVHTAENDAFAESAIMTAVNPDAQREQWLRDLKQGRRELEQGLRDLEQGLREREQGVREYEQGLAEREYWLNQSRQASAVMSVPYPEEWQSGMMPPEPRRNPDGTIPTEPTIPGRVTAQSQPGEQPMDDGSGTLIVQAYTARRAEPVAGAQVVVTMPTDGGEVLYKIMRTDIDGRTPPLLLPVNRKNDGGAPYAIYRVYVTADKYQPSGALSAQIFPGITGILPVELIPGEGVGF